MLVGIALILFFTGFATRAVAEPCPGISTETAKRLFDRLKSAKVDEGYHLDGVGTNQSEMEILWSLNGEKCPPIRISVENCAASADLATLKLAIPTDLLSRCPGLQSVAQNLADAVSSEHPAAKGPRTPLSPWVLAVASIVIIVVAATALIRLLVLIASIRQQRISLAWQVVWVFLPSLLILAAAEIGYRALIWNIARHDAAHGNVFVLYGVGESTMVGEPFDDRLSLPSLVSEMLGQRIGERAIVVRNVAERGQGAYSQSLSFERELIHRDRSVPGAVLIYAGHNEPYLGDRRKNTIAATADEQHASQLTRLLQGHTGQLIARIWLLRDALLYVRSLHFLWPQAGAQRYEWSLRRMIEVAHDNGLTPILFTLPSNISGIEPNAYEKDTPGIAAILEQGSAIEHAQEPGAALAFYGEKYLAADSNSPSALLLLYRIAHCEAALARYDDARRDYWAVVNEDPRLNFGRATDAQNNLIRRLGIEYSVPVVDAVAAFEHASTHEILGDDLFADGHHPNLRGYFVLASACAKRAAAELHGELHLLSGEAEISSRFGIGEGEMRRVHVASGAWLIATAAYHPWPMDRLARAEAHFRAAINLGDDFSVWLGIALCQAGRNGFLRNADNLDLLGKGRVYYSRELRLPAEQQTHLLELLRNFSADEAIVRKVRATWPEDGAG